MESFVGMDEFLLIFSLPTYKKKTLEWQLKCIEKGQQKHKIPAGVFKRANTLKAYMKLTSVPMD